MPESKMSENKRDYEVGRGKPPVHTRFKKGQSGNPRGPRPKNLPAAVIIRTATRRSRCPSLAVPPPRLAAALR